MRSTHAALAGIVFALTETLSAVAVAPVIPGSATGSVGSVTPGGAEHSVKYAFGVVPVAKPEPATARLVFCVAITVVGVTLSITGGPAIRWKPAVSTPTCAPFASSGSITITS